uniref:EGF-like domain-containing protein n=1 Tax=Romanomermis culicivorax TaxID=13658 RepID=A0A915HYV9_ROMCU
MKKPSKATTRTTTTRKFSTTTIRKPTTTSTRKETTVSKPTTIVEKATTTKIVPTTTSKPTTRTSPMTKTSMTTTKASTTKISPTKKTPPTTKTPLTMKTPPMTNMPLTTKTPPTTKKPSTTKKLPEATTALEVAKPSTVAAANALSGVCGSSPCKNNGICREIRGKLTNSVQVFVGHVCLCQDRFTGYNCELEIGRFVGHIASPRLAYNKTAEDYCNLQRSFKSYCQLK